MLSSRRFSAAVLSEFFLPENLFSISSLQDGSSVHEKYISQQNVRFSNELGLFGGSVNIFPAGRVCFHTLECFTAAGDGDLQSGRAVGITHGFIIIYLHACRFLLCKIWIFFFLASSRVLIRISHFCVLREIHNTCNIHTPGIKKAAFHVLIYFTQTWVDSS